MHNIKPRNERLEFILRGLSSGTLELDSSKQNIEIIKSDIESMGYDITYELEDKSKSIYHLHIRRK